MCIHADDILLAAEHSSHDKLLADLAKSIQLKPAVTLGAEWQLYLGKLWRRTEHGFEVKIPLAYDQSMQAELGLDRCRPASNPGWTAGERCQDDTLKLNALEAGSYRRVVGQLLWLIADRPDLAFTAKQLSRRLQDPSQQDMANLKRTIRFTRSTSDYVRSLNYNANAPPELCIFSNAAWANSSDYRGTPGGVAMCQDFVISSWARTQATVSQSTAASELIAGNLAVAEGTFLRHLFMEIQAPMALKVYTDAAATYGFALRTGVGRMRHLTIKAMYVQQEVKAGRVEMRRVAGIDNVAD